MSEITVDYTEAAAIFIASLMKRDGIDTSFGYLGDVKIFLGSLGVHPPSDDLKSFEKFAYQGKIAFFSMQARRLGFNEGAYVSGIMQDSKIHAVTFATDKNGRKVAEGLAEEAYDAGLQYATSSNYSWIEQGVK